MRYIPGPVVGILVFNVLEMLAINTLLTWKIMAGVMMIIIAFFVPEGVMDVMYRLYDVLKASMSKGVDV
ncbi:MAG: hypothetical protein NXY59_06865 [Aigarchaeota archaeon]|nr:hypothetical protein [Candidatus Pelearchaeum maunauluense]